MERITVKANPNCKHCLGSGIATPLAAICGNPVCDCVVEQLRIEVTDKDHSVPAEKRYSPGKPEFVKVARPQ